MNFFIFRKLKKISKTKLSKNYAIKLVTNLKNSIRIWDRACFILPFFNQYSYSIHNGRFFSDKNIVKFNYVSFYRFGEFSFTRRLGKNLHVHLEKKKDKKDLRKKKI